ncbi:hypothetical protein MMC28_007896 [Mycoblastus sanguinarius]|nr:hypothetical protein [Mycoblastus sanguinarius]
MSKQTILITGANRGIGFSILQALATRSPSNHYLLAAHSKENGTKALEELPKLGVQTEINVIALDVSKESSIRAAEEEVRTNFGRLDCVVNNAGIAILEKPDGSNIQESYTETFNTNITGVALMTSVFLPLMKKTSSDPRIINISSARASLQLSSTGNLPPSRVISYSVSKTALNALTLEYAKAESDVSFYAASPGHCKTAFNGFRGTKDPIDGAKVVVELAFAEKGKYGSGFWQMELDEKKASRVPW